MTATTFVDWAAARRAVAEAGPRLTAMLRSLSISDARALGEWDVTQLAAHVSHGMDTITAMSNGGGNILDDISGLASLTKVMVQGEGRRPLAELADRIDASVTAFVAAMEAAGEDRSVAWFTQGSELPLSALTCHMLNELTVHGYDIARAAGRPWPIDRGHATLVVMGFLLPALNTLGRSMVVQDEAANVRARFELRLRGDGRAWLRFHDGDFSVEGSPQGRADCHLSVDPAAFMLVAWGRLNQWNAIPRGQLLAWGRKPWLGLQIRSWLRNP
ncbi:MAG: maleylpyruvate isomerase family mycothiol-dependent enzyme [Actinomycetota bacterium]|nr:maleylpyruvate isomerase family mycothiol-dependent enzyme [Actinomycetota bacterium]